MFCRRQRRSFLVDSGADVSVYPASPAQKKGQRSSALRAANGTSISTYGSKSISLLFPGLSVVHRFLLADVRKPILGTDFFRAKNLVIDIPRRRLVHSPDVQDSAVVVHARPAQFVGGLCGLRCVSNVVTSAALDSLFAAFPAVTTPSQVYDSAPPKHGVFHTVPTSGPPVFARARRLFGEKLQVAKDEFQKMVDMGIIRPSNSPWSSPLHVVPKADGGWRPCGDYRSCLLYTSPSPRDLSTSRMPSSA